MFSAFTYICNTLFTYEILLEHFLQKIYNPGLFKFLTTNNLNPQHKLLQSFWLTYKSNSDQHFSSKQIWNRFLLALCFTAGFCKHGSAHSGSIKNGEFLVYGRDLLASQEGLCCMELSHCTADYYTYMEINH